MRWTQCSCERPHGRSTPALGSSLRRSTTWFNLDKTTLGAACIQEMTRRKWWFSVTRSAACFLHVSTGRAQSCYLQAAGTERRSVLRPPNNPWLSAPNPVRSWTMCIEAKPTGSGTRPYEMDSVLLRKQEPRAIVNCPSAPDSCFRRRTALALRNQPGRSVFHRPLSIFPGRSGHVRLPRNTSTRRPAVSPQAAFACAGP